MSDSYLSPESLIRNLPGMICRFKNDIDWTMEFMSEGCFELTGYTPFELIGNRITSYGKITIKEDNLLIWDIIQKAILEDKKYQIEYRILTKEGEVKWLWEQGSAVYDEFGKFVAIESFITNISKQKKIELELQNTIRELQERNLELDTFSYKISHDIRSPLRSIHGLTQVMRNETSVNNIHNYCDRIDATAHKLELFTKDLLIYTRSKEHNENPEPINFPELIMEALIDAGHPDYQEIIRLKTTISLEREVISEKFRLKVILGNLFSNAIKYRDTNKIASKLDVKIESGPKHYAINIKDNGIGIEEEYHAEIFKMFFRATEISEGTGLGLYIVKMNADMLNGSIRCESEKNLGTVFTLIFPHLY